MEAAKGHIKKALRELDTHRCGMKKARIRAHLAFEGLANALCPDWARSAVAEAGLLGRAFAERGRRGTKRSLHSLELSRKGLFALILLWT